MLSEIDRRRLADGATAKTMLGCHIHDLQDCQELYRIMYYGAVALQSLDDLGTPEANQAAWDDMEALEKEMNRLKTLAKERWGTNV